MLTELETDEMELELDSELDRNEPGFDEDERKLELIELETELDRDTLEIDDERDELKLDDVPVLQAEPVTTGRSTVPFDMP